MNDRLPSHPSALDLSRALHITPTVVYDAFAAVGQHVGNVPRRTAVAIVRDFIGDAGPVPMLRAAGAL